MKSLNEISTPKLNANLFLGPIFKDPDTQEYIQHAICFNNGYPGKAHFKATEFPNIDNNAYISRNYGSTDQVWEAIVVEPELPRYIPYPTLSDICYYGGSSEGCNFISNPEEICSIGSECGFVRKEEICGIIHDCEWTPAEICALGQGIFTTDRYVVQNITEIYNKHIEQHQNYWDQITITNTVNHVTTPYAYVDITFPTDICSQVSDCFLKITDVWNAAVMCHVDIDPCYAADRCGFLKNDDENYIVDWYNLISEILNVNKCDAIAIANPPERILAETMCGGCISELLNQFAVYTEVRLGTDTFLTELGEIRVSDAIDPDIILDETGIPGLYEACLRDSAYDVHNTETIVVTTEIISTTEIITKVLCSDLILESDIPDLYGLVNDIITALSPGGIEVLIPCLSDAGGIDKFILSEYFPTLTDEYGMSLLTKSIAEAIFNIMSPVEPGFCTEIASTFSELSELVWSLRLSDMALASDFCAECSDYQYTATDICVAMENAGCADSIDFTLDFSKQTTPSSTFTFAGATVTGGSGVIDWGDSTSETISLGALPSHTYADTSTNKTVKITGPISITRDTTAGTNIVPEIVAVTSLKLPGFGNDIHGLFSNLPNLTSAINPDNNFSNAAGLYDLSPLSTSEINNIPGISFEITTTMVNDNFGLTDRYIKLGQNQYLLINWGDGAELTRARADTTPRVLTFPNHTYATPGTYTVSITGNFNALSCTDTNTFGETHITKVFGVNPSIPNCDISGLFRNCTNITTAARWGSRAPIVDNIYNGCTSLVTPYSEWTDPAIAMPSTITSHSNAVANTTATIQDLFTADWGGTAS